MSSEGIKLVRSAYTAFNKRDPDALGALLTDDFVADMSRSVGPEAGIYEGLQAFNSLLNAYWQGFEEFLITAVEVFESDGFVVAITRGHGKGRTSGVRAVGRAAHVWRLADGKLAGWTVYQTPAEARQAVGLRE
jgi:ketosteroid isomerase-like protein